MSWGSQSVNDLGAPDMSLAVRGLPASEGKTNTTTEREAPRLSRATRAPPNDGPRTYRTPLPVGVDGS
jgi:hypothetical protein